MSTPLVDSLENATDEEIVEASGKLTKRITKKFLIGVAISVAAHFASEALIQLIENQKKAKREITE